MLALVAALGLLRRPPRKPAGRAGAASSWVLQIRRPRRCRTPCGAFARRCRRPRRCEIQALTPISVRAGSTISATCPTIFIAGTGTEQATCPVLFLFFAPDVLFFRFVHEGESGGGADSGTAIRFAILKSAPESPSPLVGKEGAHAKHGKVRGMRAQRTLTSKVPENRHRGCRRVDARLLAAPSPCPLPQGERFIAPRPKNGCNIAGRLCSSRCQRAGQGHIISVLDLTPRHRITRPSAGTGASSLPAGRRQGGPGSPPPRRRARWDAPRARPATRGPSASRRRCRGR